MRSLAKIIKIMIFLFISGVITLTSLYVYAYFSPQLDLKNTSSFFLYDDKNDLVYQGSKTSEWVDLKDINKFFINATISVEDKNFYSHQGFDYLRIGKAMLNNIKSQSLIEGASTISQQYARNMYLDFSKSWKRKIDEAFLALQLEVHYSKEDILTGYLNTINYGQGNYGIQNASKYYFNKKVSELSMEESLMLSSIPKNPSHYNPVTDYDKCVERAKIVAKTMITNKYLTEEQYNNLFKNKIEIFGKHTENNLQMIMYYQDAVLYELEKIPQIPKSLIESGGLKIYTTLNLEAQTLLENKILEHKFDDDLQVASVVTNPNDGAIIALTGGMDYSKSTYNRATNSKRQVGSTMKSFLYYAALENNLTMASTFKSEYTVFNLSNNQNYSPNNFNNKYANKDITMAAAVAFSDNIYAVKTNLFLGVDKLIEIARKTGINGHLKEVASLALGTSELNIIDYTTGYATFASGGYERDLYLINKVEDANGNVLYEKKFENNLILNPNYTYILNEMLSCTTNNKFSDYTSATGLSIANKLTKKYSLKSGTTNTDVWNVGYNPDLLMSIWMGYDKNKAITSEISRAEREIWAEVMEGLLKNKETSWYEKPDNVIAVMLDSVTGEVTTNEKKATPFYFLKGTAPGTSSFVSKND